jgi:hypothetical protein
MNIGTLFAGLFVTLLLAISARCEVVLDQENDFVSGVADSTLGNVSEVGQTFTVGVDGTLDRVEVLMFRLGGIFEPTADPTIHIYQTSGGLPDGAPLASVVIPKALVPYNIAGFVSFDVSSAALPVHDGDVLAFGISTSSSVGPYFLLVAADNYAGGDSVNRLLNPPGGPPDPWQLPNAPFQDHGFRTFVETTGAGPTVVAPDSLTVTRGNYVSGDATSLASSDNLDLALQRLNTDIQSRTEFEVMGTSPTATPTRLDITLEGAVFARSTVVQTIELWDRVAAEWELVDTRNATNITDSTVTVVTTGDLSRFVDQSNLSMRARIHFQSLNPRQRFASNTDQFVWTIE